jgi:hypothetical protein
MPAKAFLLLVCVLVLGAAGAGAATREPAVYEIRADGTGQRLVGGRGAIAWRSRPTARALPSSDPEARTRACG